jgi:hypothetical protein
MYSLRGTEQYLLNIMLQKSMLMLGSIKLAIFYIRLAKILVLVGWATFHKLASPTKIIGKEKNEIC